MCNKVQEKQYTILILEVSCYFGSPKFTLLKSPGLKQTN